MEDYVPRVKSQKLRELVLECSSLGRNSQMFFDIGLKDFEDAMVKSKVNVDFFEIRRNGFTKRGEKTRNFVVDYMKSSVDRIYEFVYPTFSEGGVMFFVSSANSLDNIRIHADIKFHSNSEYFRALHYGHGTLLSANYFPATIGFLKRFKTKAKIWSHKYS